jgi:hypothetical protein
MILCLHSRKAQYVYGLIITREEYTSKEMESFVRNKTEVEEDWMNRPL